MDFRGMRTLKAALFGVAAAAVCLLGTEQRARADFLFNPTGVGGAGGAFSINGFDPAPGNAVGVGSVTAINNVTAAGGTGADVAANRFQLYYIATTSSLVGPSPANNPLTPAGLNSAYQITYVASVTEYVSSANAATGTATFAISGTQAANSVLQIYSNGPAGGIVADNATGLGFTAGTLILSATPVVSAAGIGNFTNAAGNPVLFDQHNADNFGGKQTVAGSGSSTVDFRVTSTNANYFITPPPTISAVRFITSQSTPFIVIEPTGAAAGTGFPNPLGVGPIIPNLGAINGRTGPDFQFVADAFVTVPEPSSVCLMGLGLCGAVAVLRRRSVA